MADEKLISWRDIKEIANSLSEEQLTLPVRYWTESEGGKVMDANLLPEDYVSDGEGYVPRSEMPEEYIDVDEPIMPKGTPMLWINI